MKKLFNFVKEYWEFAVTAVVLVAGLIAAAITRDFNNDFSRYLIIAWAIIVGTFLIIDMIKTLRSGRYGVDILAITAIGACIAVGQYWAALVIILMLTGGETLEDYAANRAKRELSDLLKRAPQIAHLVKGSKVEDVKVSEVQIDHVVLVKPHEVVPVDGVLISDAAEFDESSLTGESLPVEKKAGDSVMSGALNGDVAVKIRATADAAHSQYEQIIALVRDAESQPAPFVRLADRYAVPFTLVSYTIAGAAWAISGEALRFAEVLVVASPCPLILAAPIALISGMSRASRHGIIVKNGAVLEKLNRVTVFAFDKTGTLTHGDVEVSQVDPIGNLSEKDLLSLAASAEANSTHILATSLVEYAKKNKIKIQSTKNLREITGDGVFANIGAKKVLVGRAEFLKKNKIKDFSDAHAAVDQTAIFVAVDNKFAGTIYFADQVRKESRHTLKELKQLGVKETVMLTGDRESTAAKIAQKVGIDRVFAQLLPADKVKTMRNICGREDSVAFVGDGVNDAPTLAASDVGIAMGARGSTAAGESADAVIMLDDLSRVALLRKISMRTIRVALQSVWVGIALCLVLMGFAAFGFIPALVGAGLQELIDVTVIFNALRAHSGGWGSKAKTA
ncbi:cadmium-translocating P-type ATPase [Candidatus Saccharibacteria bacterium]|nr:cadmium-translocating P-type ATPase [Candidatus Saccharibacteria bacterium]